MSPIVYDSRVYRTVKSLRKKYSILVLGWNRENIPKNVIENYITDLKVCNLRAPRGKSISHSPKMVICIIYYWTWLFIELTKFRPDIVHSCDLDTAIPCYLYKLVFRKKMIFDVFDRYAMAYVPTNRKLYYSILNYLEEFFSDHANVLITISNAALATFRKRPKYSTVIMNCPEDHPLDNPDRREDGPFRVVYTGQLLKSARGLEDITAAIKDLPGVEFVIAGWYLERDKRFLDDILQIPNVKFKGLLPPDDALALEASSDAMIGLYEPDNWNHIMLPNKLFEAMMCGVPLITNIGSEILKEVGFGIGVKYNDVEQIKEAIVSLRDNPASRRNLGLNGRNAFLEKYNWSKMEEELFNIYEICLEGSKAVSEY